MARPPRIDFEGGTYHVIARGNEQRDIFRDGPDRRRYLSRLADCREKFGFFCYAFCLMTNHVHLLVERGSTPLSRIMLNLQSPYSQYFNRRYGRAGHFQGRYKAFLVDRERYFVSVLRYIHSNPVQAGMVSAARHYPWSSERCYRSGAGPAWLDLDRGLSFLAPKRSLAVAAYRRLSDGSGCSAYDELPAIRNVIKGDDDFANLVLRRLGEPPRPRAGLTPEIVAQAVAAAQRLTLGALQQRRLRRDLARARGMAAYLARQEAGISMARMARYFGRDESTLVRNAKRVEESLRTDEVLRHRIEAIAQTLRL